MRTKAVLLTGVTLAFAAGCGGAGNPGAVEDQAAPTAGFAAVPAERGGVDITGPYEVVLDWPKPLSNLPGHENWTWGSGQGVFAESPDRVFMLQRGELPAIQRPARTSGDRARPLLPGRAGAVPQCLAGACVESAWRGPAWRRSGRSQ